MSPFPHETINHNPHSFDPLHINSQSQTPQNTVSQTPSQQNGFSTQGNHLPTETTVAGQGLRLPQAQTSLPEDTITRPAAFHSQNRQMAMNQPEIPAQCPLN